MGVGAATPPPQLHAASAGPTQGSGAKGYVIAASAVAAVLLVGGALLFLVDTDGSGDVRSSDSVVEVGEADPVSDPNTTPGSDAETASTSTPELLRPEAVSTEPAAVDALTTVAGAPTTPGVTPPAVTAPPVTAPPVTAPPATAAPVIAPAPTAAPTVAPRPAPVPALTFEQADGFFRNYVALASSGDYTTAWSLLSSSDQADYTNGFDQFVGFWRSVSFADVQSVDSVGGSTGFQSLTVDMAYGQADGDPTSFEIAEVDVNIRPDGSLQIFDYRYIRNQ